MKSGLVASLALAALLATVLPSPAQTPRKDFIWARSTAGAPLTLDGVLNEPAWAMADSVVIHMSQDTGIPGSGWFFEAGISPSDPTNATLRFLSVGNQIWMGAYIRDHSIGGSNVFNRFDGLLMAIKNQATPWSSTSRSTTATGTGRSRGSSARTVSGGKDRGGVTRSSTT